ncbi:tRNA-uridine aminocarboxypropyltransferase [Bowmanella dokdonensis]|uniref:tRNA-uridine aminocarboxypropyltransferase n=1 Tax=Bowmanella dokdonensis TaxID=751969 RepID=A0A939DN46_9ALTE|nr:tRNA-uridine aminocarboxypropyltransferase [Bowmanella dokdonensis]MBN7825843.1 DTW domain-containing protein [Bowmanella dokdonensis]
MSPRQYCAICRYPQSVCLCHLVRQLDNQTRLIVLQHPSEIRVAKNTLRLLALCLTRLDIVVGETPEDFMAVEHYCRQQPQHVAVLYPNPESAALEQSNSSRVLPKALILIDGTWRKAFRIWQLNTWLHGLRCYHLESPPASRYKRKARAEHQLSTLEAAAHALTLLESLDCDPLYQLQDERQRRLSARGNGLSGASSVLPKPRPQAGW